MRRLTHKVEEGQCHDKVRAPVEDGRHGDGAAPDVRRENLTENQPRDYKYNNNGARSICVSCVPAAVRFGIDECRSISVTRWRLATMVGGMRRARDTRIEKRGIPE